MTSSSGSMVSARLGLVLTIRIMLPTISNGARVPIRSDIWVRVFRAATSLVRRTINCPVFCRSRLPNENVWILRKSASRRSRATLSPTCTDRMLLATAITVLRMDRPIIIREVWITTVWLCFSMPWLMMRSIRSGMDRSIMTSEDSRIRATVARLQ